MKGEWLGMLTKQLQRTLFSMKRVNLEKKIESYYQDTQDTDSVVEYAIAALVRGGLTTNDFSFFLYELIRELFLHAEPSDTMRKFCSFLNAILRKKRGKRV